MTRQIIAHEPTLPGLVPDAEAARLIASFRVSTEGARMMVDRMPSAVERQSLQTRAAALATSLAPISASLSAREDAAEAIAGLLVAYGYARNDRASTSTVTLYVQHLESIPLFAIKAACEDVKAGRVFDIDQRTGNRKPLNPDKEPSTIRLRAVAQKHVDRLAEEKWRFDRILLAKYVADAPVPEHERKAVAARFVELKADLERRAAKESIEDVERRVAREEAQRRGAERLIEAEYEALGLAPVRQGGVLVSLSMMKQGGWRVEETNFGGDIRRKLVRGAPA